ncbi:MAG: diadenylate cyclase CdaA [Defluviitaleaceae bacterium]|nr:diadenylate cyclase CdaA [Defluviitaleaceae bacterium]
MNNLLSWHITPLFIISISDILEISILSFVIYKIFMWIKDTRAMSLFKGVIIIFAISGISILMRFETILWLFSNLFNVGILTVVILFQPELRKALEEIGRGKFSLNFQEKFEEEDLKNSTMEIIDAVTKMSVVGTGALILVERNSPLGEIEATGVKLDAIISKQLILNIFEDNAPLHDGAVIIRKNRIAAASCILPLTETEIGKELGTRHRAAVGVTELYDCIAIIVSEETSHISISISGKLIKNVDKEKLQKTLIGTSVYKKRLYFWKGTSGTK